MGAIMWLASYPKSGNTWMRSFLHNLLRSPGESYDINKLSDFTLGESQAPWYQMFDPRPVSDYTLDEVRRMRPLVHRKMTESHPDTIFVKTHNALLEDAGHPMVTLDVTAGAIYVIRDPRDIAISYSHHLNISIDETIALLNNEGAATGGDAVNVYEFMSTWSRHVYSWTNTPNPQLLVIRYEDLLASPTKTFGSVVRFLGLNPPRERVEKAIKLSSFKVLQAQERRKGFIERPSWASAFFREGKAEQWKKLLTPEQQELIKQHHGEQMVRFGYR
ncbi:MAG TPA: sulfotransferase domain-containing protein [Stellaceae bacterium]|nr:sulfotransferase domain-containing protein [Stellaceae bacterium]